ncbi:MAG: methyltransferase domain-containing protein [Vicinamibacterales bacterium]
MVLATRKSNPYQLVVGMSGLALGDRFVQIGCAHGGRLGAMAARVGLSGHAAVVVPDEATATRARKGAEGAGVFIEIKVEPLERLPFDAGTFELAIVDDTDGLMATMPPPARLRVLQEALRVLEPGGRALIIGTLPASGLGALFGRGRKTPPLNAEPLLAEAGFLLTRVLGESEGLRFTEAVKRRAGV